jgi:hypothetical protein
MRRKLFSFWSVRFDKNSIECALLKFLDAEEISVATGLGMNVTPASTSRRQTIAVQHRSQQNGKQQGEE